MITQKIKNKIDAEYEFAYEITKLVDEMLNGEFQFDRSIMIRFLSIIGDPLMNEERLHSTDELVEACRPYFIEDNDRSK